MTDHTQEAHRHINWAHEWQEMEGETPEANLANAHLAVAFATLELAEQQRIANLIALAELGDRVFGGYAGDAGLFSTIFDQPTTSHGNVSVKPEIAAALGITEKS